MATNKEKDTATESRGLGPRDNAKDSEEQELERLAMESLLEDARRRRRRVEKVGTMGWVKERNVNKRFLNSLVLQTLPRQRITATKRQESELKKDISAERKRVCVGVDSRECGRDRDRDEDSTCDGIKITSSKKRGKDRELSPRSDRAAGQQRRSRDRRRSPSHFRKDAHAYSRQQQFRGSH